MTDGTEAAIDELFAGPPDEFVTRRDRLAADLRRAGDGEGAARVKALRRPTVAAAALNHVAHDAPELVAAFLDASQALRRSQESGEPAARLRAAITEQRAARRAVMDAAATSARSGAASVADEVAATLDAAALDDAVARSLAAGRLHRAETQISAFATLDLPVTPAAERPRRRPLDRSDPESTAAAEPPPRPASDAKLLAAAARLDEARRAVADAESAVDAADAAVRAAQRTLDDAQRTRDAARRRLDRARASAQRAQEALDRL